MLQVVGGGGYIYCELARHNTAHETRVPLDPLNGILRRFDHSLHMANKILCSTFSVDRCTTVILSLWPRSQVSQSLISIIIWERIPMGYAVKTKLRNLNCWTPAAAPFQYLPRIYKKTNGQQRSAEKQPHPLGVGSKDSLSKFKLHGFLAGAASFLHLNIC